MKDCISSSKAASFVIYNPFGISSESSLTETVQELRTITYGLEDETRESSKELLRKRSPENLEVFWELQEVLMDTETCHKLIERTLSERIENDQAQPFLKKQRFLIQEKNQLLGKEIRDVIYSHTQAVSLYNQRYQDKTPPLFLRFATVLSAIGGSFLLTHGVYPKDVPMQKSVVGGVATGVSLLAFGSEILSSFKKASVLVRKRGKEKAFHNFAAERLEAILEKTPDANELKWPDNIPVRPFLIIQKQAPKEGCRFK